LAFGTDFRFRNYFDKDWNRLPNPEPERIYGPLYSVGPISVTAYLIETDDGLILIDTGNRDDGDLVADNIRKLGFDPADVKMILLTHWHWDHTGGAARMKELSKAPVMIHTLDAEVVETGTYHGEGDIFPSCQVDRRLKDGEVIEHGGVSLTTLHCPGQSAGEVVFTTTLDGPDGPCRVLLAGDASGFKNSKSGAESIDRLGYPGVCADYRKTVEILKALEFDLFCGGHPHMVFREMREDGSPFITREEWHKHVDGRHQKMEEFVEEYPEYLGW
jgi:metallo-beta-lactamase class B